MKSLKQHIKESFKIGRNKMTYYNYFPKTKDELRKIIEERLKENSNADLNDIDTSKITDMSLLFNKLDPHDINVSEWDVSNVENMFGMFAYCKNFKGIGLENWDVSDVKDMSHMFEGCKNFNYNLGKWNVSNVEDMRYMFYLCNKFKGEGLENWNVSNVENMYLMFGSCKNLKCDLSKWDVSNVRHMDGIFTNCTSLKNKPSWYKV